MTEQSRSIKKVIVFQINNEEYTVPVDQVGSIERMMPITRVPGTSAFVKGVLNLRGVVTPVIDLRERFGLPFKEADERTRIITVTVGELNVGLIVDAANDVLDLDETEVEPPPEIVGTVEAEYIQGVAKQEHRLLILLNLEKILSEEEAKSLQKAGN